MSKGIIILSLGHVFFGRLAHNLAVSIKHNEPDMPIALVWAGAALDHLKVFELAKHFDHIIEAPIESYTRNGKTEYIKAKTFMYDLSPFDETIYIDADTLWLPRHKPSELFNQFREVDFTIQNTNKHIEWASLDEIRKEYNLPDEKYVPVSSEFVYFRKCDHVMLFFERVKYNYDNLKVKLTGKAKAGFSGGIPDELPFLISMMQLNEYPHQIPYIPVYWQTKEKQIPSLEVLHEKYFLLSCGGKFVGEWTKKHYDRLVTHYFSGANLRYIWKHQNKRSFLPERSII